MYGNTDNLISSQAYRSFVLNVYRHVGKGYMVEVWDEDGQQWEELQPLRYSSTENIAVDKAMGKIDAYWWVH
jgi:hypothetical protein